MSFCPVLYYYVNTPGYLVRAGHGDEPLALQDAVPRLNGGSAPDRQGPLPRLDLGPQVAVELPHQVSSAVH